MIDTLGRLRSALRGRYEVEREIGAGGMATVYLARDVRHRRAVAVKVLRPELAGTVGSERFLREIELAAGLQHPHILPVFDSGEIGEPDRLLWYVMPFVEGESLRARLVREGRLSVEGALKVAREVADALDYAHARGVVHRDVKPENILLTGGHAMVADFGIAKAFANPSASLTTVGLAMGTPHYMSPEQASGTDAVGPAADQYSLGCVLYEMLTGQTPFTGSSPQSVLAQSLATPRPRARAKRPEVPAHVEEVILRAMAQDPTERFPDMAAFGEALARAAPRPAAPARRRVAVAAGAALAAFVALAVAWFGRERTAAQVASGAELIAVFPFITSGPGVELMDEGMVDLLATNLDGVGSIRTVDPRTVLARWRERSGRGRTGLATALTVGRDVGAGSVVLGSVVAAGGRVRLAADLYSVGGNRLGHAQVDGATDSVLTLADRLSLALVREVWRSREPIPRIGSSALVTESPEALREFLRGEQHYRRMEFDSALAAYERATELDSTFATAHFRRAIVYGWTAGYGNDASRQAAAAGFRFAGRLPARERELLGAYRVFERGELAAVDSLRRFTEVYPHDIEGWYLLGEALFHSRAFTGESPDTIRAAFDSAVARDSSLVPALLHPAELSLLYRDSSAFRRYAEVLGRQASPEDIRIGAMAADLAWGTVSNSAMRTLMARPDGPGMEALLSVYQRPNATSDTVVRLLARAQATLPRTHEGHRNLLVTRTYALAGLGRLGEARRLADSVAAVAPDEAIGVLGWPVVFGIAPESFGGERLRNWLRSPDSVPEVPYALAVRELGRGQPDRALRRIESTLASRDTVRLPPTIRGLLVGARGWARLQQGDTAAGIAELRRGLREAAAPNLGTLPAVLHLQLALALSSRSDTRSEGIRRLRHGFDTNPLVLPLTFLGIAQAYEAGGIRDSAAAAYGQFVRLWDRADPEMQPRVREAREALERVTGEQ